MAQHAATQLNRTRLYRAFKGEAKHDKHPKNHNRNANTYIRKLTEDTNIPNKPVEGITPMKIPYKQEIRICSLNVRGMKESAKREQIILQMMRHNIDIACLQETHIHDSSIETRDKHSFVFSSSALNKKDDWGVGFCFKNGFEKYRTSYVQISSNVATLELSMHRNPLVIVTAYMPHDAVLPIQQPRRIAAWEELETTINNITEAKNIIICGDFNAALHHIKEDEEDIIGNHIFGKGIEFLRTKEDRQEPEFVDNRAKLVSLARSTNTIIANTFFQKHSNTHKITYKAMTTQIGPPWTSDRYYEIDHCLVKRHWRNSILDIQSDPYTNVNTDHYMIKITIRQALKAKEIAFAGPTLKCITLPEGNEEQALLDFNEQVASITQETTNETHQETNLKDL